MEKFDLGLAFVWEYDDDFINLTEDIFQKAGLKSFRVTNYNINEVRERILARDLTFSFYLDRAWDVNENFEELGKILAKRKTVIFNPYNKVLHAIDKASMHLEFITAGLHVPYSIIIPPHSEKEEIYISIDDLALLGRPFIIKPCNTTGGGVGVVTGAETLKEILDERVTNSDDKYILQEKIYPNEFKKQRAWFRSFWAFGKALPVWWDDQTHIYEKLTNEDIIKYNLKSLYNITRRIAKVIQLDFFSTEIVYTNNSQFLVIDYVNDQCDMRLKSKHVDGVPDEVVVLIIKNMLRRIKNIKNKQHH